jgi:hypothetical protein
MWPFQCKHPADRLAVWGRTTVEPVDDDYELHTVRLYCRRCNGRIDLKATMFVGGVDAFLERGMPKLKPRESA